MDNNKIYHITYVVGNEIDVLNMCLRSFEWEYRDYNVKFIPIEIDKDLWGIDIIGKFNNVLKVVQDFRPLGEYIEEPYTNYIKEVE